MRQIQECLFDFDVGIEVVVMEGKTERKKEDEFGGVSVMVMQRFVM